MRGGGVREGESEGGWEGENDERWGGGKRVLCELRVKRAGGYTDVCVVTVARRYGTNEYTQDAGAFPSLSCAYMFLWAFVFERSS